MQNYKMNNLGIPDFYGNYNYPVLNGRVLVDPTISNIPIEPLVKSNNVIPKQKSYFIQFIIIILFILVLSGGIYFLYTKIKTMGTYIDNDFTTFVKNTASSTSKKTFDTNFNIKINNTTNAILSELSNNIDNKIVPSIINQTSKLYVPNTSAIKTANFNKTDYIFLSNNTMICTDINDPDSCTCLYDTCDVLKSLPNYLLIDRQISFTDPESTGLSFSGNVIPTIVDSDNNRITNKFSLSFHINITKTVQEDRILFNWGGYGSHLLHYPSVIIRGNTEPDYNGLYRNSMELRFSHLGQNGIFNVTSDVRGNCLENIPLYVWNHILIVANEKQIKIFLNGTLVKTITTLRDILIGDPDQWLFIGKPFNEPILKNPYGILLAKMRFFPDAVPDDYAINYKNEFLKN
jgi:hypothetical protein